ncbi:MAG TPA: MG2 domain-containing protein, partial [Planctomycetota bacterium]|nr:MG2 domain-containing protein [Planctomycetota bacterium]
MSDLNTNSQPPPELDDPAAQRREKMMAFHLGALDNAEEIALIRGRLESDPDWQRASREASDMLEALEKHGPVSAPVPAKLGERTTQRLREAKQPKRRTEPEVLSRPARPARPAFVFSPKLAAAILLIAALPGLFFAVKYLTAQSSAESIYWRAEKELAAGAPFSPYLIVRDAKTQQPASDIKLVGFLSSEKGGAAIKIGESQTDANGVISGPPWKIPETPPGEYRLKMEAFSPSGALLDAAERPVTVRHSARLALSPDRTQARPGERIRARMLLVDSATERPLAQQDASIALFDPLGNRIALATSKTTDFGLAWAEFPLDTLAPEGTYKLRAESGGLNAERSVEVKQYRLPPFKVAIHLSAPFISTQSDAVGMTVNAASFDGHPLAGAKGELRLVEADGTVIRRQEVETRADGSGFFYMPTAGMQDGRSLEVRPVRVEATLTDAAGRTASGSIMTTLSRHDIVVNAIAEAGELVEGIENRVYIVVRRPNGSPEKTELTVSRPGTANGATTLQTDDHGVAVYTLASPQQPAEVLRIQPLRHKIEPLSISLPIRSADHGRLLLRTDKAVVQSGDTIKVSLLSPQSGNAAIALRQDGRTVAVAGTPIVDGRGEAQIVVPAGASGILSLEASVHSGRATWTDRRMLRVSGSSAMRVVAAADKPAYRPGDAARLNFTVTDATGNGIPAAVSVVGVDEALLALTGEHPGLAQALQNAGVNVLNAPTTLNPLAFSPDEGASEGAKAALAGLQPDDALPPVVDNSAQSLEKAEAETRQARRTMNEWFLGLIPVFMMLAVLLLTFYPAKNASPERSSEAAEFAIPWLTFGIGALGWLLCGDDRSISWVTWLTFCAPLVIGHHLLLRPSSTTALHVVTIIADLLVLAFAAVAVGEDAGRGALTMLGIVFVVACVAQWLSLASTERLFGPGVVLKAAAAGCVLLVLGGMLLPTLSSARYKSRVAGALESKRFSGDEAMIVVTSLAAKAELGDHFDIIENIVESPSSSPRLRWDFPETMIFAPEIITNESGRASFDLTVADSLTTWSVLTDAVARSGGTSHTHCSLVVTQPLSVDLTLPTDVTAGDTLSVPAVLSNHTDKRQVVDVRLEITGATILEGPLPLPPPSGGGGNTTATRQVTVEPKSVAAAEFTLNFTAPGRAALKVTAKTPTESDAVERTLPVLPDGRPVEFSSSALVHEREELSITVPPDALPGSTHSTLVLHRGPLTQMIEGLDSMLRQPHGCFEQTSSTSYPNVMILKYLRAYGIKKPEIEARAQNFIAQGYQRLLTFEINRNSGSFSLYGQSPASAWLTAYGLLQFTDTAEVFPVDPALLERTRAWLKQKMRDDGSYPLDSYRVHETAPQGIAATAYVVWALGKSAPEASIQYLRRNGSQIEKDAYLCALAANALLAHDRALAAQLAGKLRNLAAIGENKAIATLQTAGTLSWGYGDSAAIEASALGALALLETGQDMTLARQLLAFLQSKSSPYGGWGSTHATVLTLKALS